jgi:hypothetical protein
MQRTYLVIVRAIAVARDAEVSRSRHYETVETKEIK